MPRAAIVGAGMAGLTAGYLLASEGFDVTVYELAGVPGGLAAPCLVAGTEVDRYYHFVCPPDTAYINLLEGLGLSDRLKWAATSMGQYYEGVRYRFGTLSALMRFPPLSLGDRARFGLAALRSTGTNTPDDLDRMSARDWLISQQGERCYEVVWRPLLELKFGDSAEDVPAAWMRARMNRIALSRRGLPPREVLGYVEGGTATVVRELVRRIETAGGRIAVGAPVDRIIIEGGRVAGVEVAGAVEPCDVALSTVATPLFVEMAMGLPEGYAAPLREVAYQGVACWLLATREPLGPDFWLNINDPRVPLPGVITYTHLDPRADLGGLHLHYVPLYMPVTDPRWTIPQDTWMAEVIDALDVVRPGFSSEVVEALLFRDPYAQPLYGLRYAERLSRVWGPETPIGGLYRIDMGQAYPADRSIVNAVGLAGRACRAMVEREAAGGPSCR